LKEPAKGTTWYFVDESGDPTFFDSTGNLIVGTEGCSPILIMGFIETRDPQAIRKGLESLRQQLMADPYLAGIPSISKTKNVFHAKDDCPEVRQAVFKKLNEFDFKAQFVVARKIEQIFRSHFGCEENEFYDYLITTLFRNVLHRYESSRVYFAKRGSKKRQKPLRLAIQNAMEAFEKRWKTNIVQRVAISISAQSPSGEPCLQVIDYMNWAVYRAFVSQEMRFYKAIESKVSLLVDIYDTKKYPNSYYHRRNPFDCNKISPILARPRQGRTA